MTLEILSVFFYVNFYVFLYLKVIMMMLRRKSYQKLSDPYNSKENIVNIIIERK